jgi:hypothetical protein
MKIKQVKKRQLKIDQKAETRAVSSSDTVRFFIYPLFFK